MSTDVWDDHKKKIYVKSEQLWKNVHPSIRPYLQFDNVSLYSVTDVDIADRMSRIIRHWFGSSTITITDAMACVGGNTSSFGKYFTHVNAVEISQQRVNMLLNNMYILGTLNKTTIYCKDYSHIWQTLKQDVVFLDPPWGGPDYRRLQHLDLYVGKINIAELAFSLISWRHDIYGVPIRPIAKMVTIKAPINYNCISLYKTARYYGMSPEKTIHIIEMGKMLFIIICAESFKCPHLPPGLVS